MSLISLHSISWCHWQALQAVTVLPEMSLTAPGLYSLLCTWAVLSVFQPQLCKALGEILIPPFVSFHVSV